MQCPLCGSWQQEVVDSRPKADSVRRRRECADCGFRFSTIEIRKEVYDRMTPPDREALRASVDRFLQNLKTAIYKALKL